MYKLWTNSVSENKKNRNSHILYFKIRTEGPEVLWTNLTTDKHCG